MFNKSFKIALLNVMIGISFQAMANQTEIKSESTNIEVDLATQQIEQQKREEAARLEAEHLAEVQRLAEEKQRQAETKLAELLQGKEQQLQLKSAVAKIYSDNDYHNLWTNKLFEKAFLKEYAALVASGISARSAKSLALIDELSSGDVLQYDIALTDAFLDYLYYTTNVINSAQNWLYTTNNYKAITPAEFHVDQWVSAVKNNDVLSFWNQISATNLRYQQTLDYLILHLFNEQQIEGESGKSSKKQKTKTDPMLEVYKLAVNVQRLRIIPDFENGIFVNIPSYQLNYYRDGELVLNSRVIVGKNERRTPVMYSKLSNVVVNPPWNAPTRLINEDIIPKVKRDPSYLERNGYSIIDSRGNVVDPYSIDWTSIGAKFPYRLRQKAGDNSALGRFKFNMPSSDAIYLHDTPNRGLFAKEGRALSSGCVRVEKSDALATILLKESGWTENRKQKVLESQKTTSVNVSSDNPVYLYYVTAWAENGKLHKLKDIYGYDSVKNLSFINWDLVKKYLR
ncbi:MAG: L,D-transpeptidase family protein [Lonepinella koalarum]|nr:L,D-transpeptidase family protein [Lonepinella koalarum]